MSKYIIYRHTLNGKHYIGYSSQTLKERLEDHIKDSIVDKSERHFHRAIRKYGAENITSVVLDSARTKSEATFKERHYIAEYDTFKNGYNMTSGGDGGNTKEKYTEEQMSEWKKTFGQRMSGMNNNNARPDVTTEAMIETIVDFIKENNYHDRNILRRDVMDELKRVHNISIEAVKRRTKNVTELIKLVNKRLIELKLKPTKYDPYYRSDEEKKHLSAKASEYGWVTDGSESKMILKSNIDKYLAEHIAFRKGRTL